MTNHTLDDYSLITKSLGLRLTRRLVEKIGGDLNIEQNTHTGTEFNLLVPRKREEKGEGSYERE